MAVPRRTGGPASAPSPKKSPGSFHSLKQGTVAINGSTGAVLGQALVGLLNLVDVTLADARLASSPRRQEPVLVAVFLTEIAAAAELQASEHAVCFTVTPVETGLFMCVDTHPFAAAVTNLLSNAFKYTRRGGRVTLGAHGEGPRILIEVEDECGGIPDFEGTFEPFCLRRGVDRSGLWLGLSIAQRAVQAHGGQIRIRNMPGKGCVFVIDIPRSLPPPPPPER